MWKKNNEIINYGFKRIIRNHKGSQQKNRN